MVLARMAGLGVRPKGRRRNWYCLISGLSFFISSSHMQELEHSSVIGGCLNLMKSLFDVGNDSYWIPLNLITVSKRCGTRLGAEDIMAAAGLTSPAGGVGPVRLFAGPIWKWPCAGLADTLKTLHFFFQIKPAMCLINHTYVLNKRLSICINLTASLADCWLQFFSQLCKIKKSMYYYQKSR